MIEVDGSFQLKEIEPGDYRLAINPHYNPMANLRYPPAYYPGVADRNQAAVIRVESGARVVLPTPWQLPVALTQMKVEAVILGPDGKPAIMADYSVLDLDGGGIKVYSGSTFPADTGLVAFNVLKGRRYRIDAKVLMPVTGILRMGSADFGPGASGRIAVNLTSRSSGAATRAAP